MQVQIIGFKGKELQNHKVGCIFHMKAEIIQDDGNTVSDRKTLNQVPNS